MVNFRGKYSKYSNGIKMDVNDIYFTYHKKASDILTSQGIEDLYKISCMHACKKKV